MAGWRQAIELALSEEEVTRLGAVARSRMEAASRVERARILLAYWEDRSFFAVAQAIGVHHQTVQRCVERALACGPIDIVTNVCRECAAHTPCACAAGDVQRAHHRRTDNGRLCNDIPGVRWLHLDMAWRRNRL